MFFEYRFIDFYNCEIQKSRLNCSAVEIQNKCTSNTILLPILLVENKELGFVNVVLVFRELKKP